MLTLIADIYLSEAELAALAERIATLLNLAEGVPTEELGERVRIKPEPRAKYDRGELGGESVRYVKDSELAKYPIGSKHPVRSQKHGLVLGTVVSVGKSRRDEFQATVRLVY